MKKSTPSLIWSLVALVFAVSATTLMLSYMVTDPTHVINELGGDCGKNYFTFLYHSVYGKGFWFDGMNYPYGEHIIYADGQPFLSTFLHWFQPLDPHYALATMNLLLSFSYVLAIWFTYKILLRFGVKQLLSVLFACLICLLSPQVMRVRAHFGLAYLCPIPMLFYWTILYHETRKWKWALYIFIMGAIMSFMHLYLGGIIFVWIALYTAGCVLLLGSSVRQRLVQVLPVVVSAVTLFIFIKSFIALTDPVTDRPSFPLNTLESVTHIRDIITSPFSPVWQFAADKLKWQRISVRGDEGFSYLGLVAITIVLFSIVIGVFKKFGKKEGKPLVSEEKFSPVWLFIAAGGLLLAMGAPFIWHLEWLLNYMSIFKQFRAMGRFSWIFYYIAAIYAVVALNSWYVNCMSANRRFFGYAMVIAALGIWAFEVSGYVKYTRDFIAIGKKTSDEFFYTNEMKWPQYLQEHHLQANDFQAIMLMPLFVSGSEKLWVGGDPSWPLSLGIRAATELHLPLVDVMMSRTSWSQTEKQVKTIAGPFADKPMLRDLKSNKPFLVLWFDSEDLDPDEADLLKSADFVGNHFRNHIYVLYPDRILANDKKHADTIKSIVPFIAGRDTCFGSAEPWLEDHYDRGAGAHQFFGFGSCNTIRGEDSVLLLSPFRVQGDNVQYELSCWFLLDDKDYRSPYLNIKQFDSSGHELLSTDVLTNRSVDNEGMWFRASSYFMMKSATRNIKVTLENIPAPSYLAMDEFQLRPAAATIISKAPDGKVLVNNHALSGR